jgi:hypothetical protein
MPREGDREEEVVTRVGEVAAARVDMEVAATQLRLHQICDMEVSGRRKIPDAG